MGQGVGRVSGAFGDAGSRFEVGEVRVALYHYIGRR